MVFAARGSEPVEAETCERPVAADVIERHENLLRAMAAGRVREVMAHYGPEVILMGVDTPSIRLGAEEVRAYYQRRLRTPPTAVVLDRSVEIACNRTTERGLKRVTWRGEAGPPELVRYVVHSRLAFGRWQIVHHHMEIVREDAGANVMAASGRLPGAVTTAGLPAANPATRPPIASQVAAPKPVAPPPAISLYEPRFILTPQGAVPRPPAEQAPEPPSRLRALAEPRLAMPAPVLVPALPIQVPPFAWTPPTPLSAVVPPLPVEAEPSNLPAPFATVSVPPLPFDVPAMPALPEAPATKPQPAVAGFTQRAADPAAPSEAPPRVAPRAQRRAPTATAPAPVTAQPKGGYRAGRWSDGMPVFE
jgi:hypothetical protein